MTKAIGITGLALAGACAVLASSGIADERASVGWLAGLMMVGFALGWMARGTGKGNDER